MNQPGSFLSKLKNVEGIKLLTSGNIDKIVAGSFVHFDVTITDVVFVPF